MPLNLSVKNVPESLAKKLRERAERNHRSLQGELMAILEAAGDEPHIARAKAGAPKYGVESTTALADSLLERLMEIAGERGIDTAKRLTHEVAHDRKSLRKHGG
jgi:plasmid stability protein